MRDGRLGHLPGGMNGPFSVPLGSFPINFALALSLHLHLHEFLHLGQLQTQEMLTNGC